MYDKTAVLTIILEKWDRGSPYVSKLLTFETGKMCCLGFECIARGIPDRQIKGIVMPYQVLTTDNSASLEGLACINGEEGRNTEFSKIAAHMNDIEPGSDFTDSSIFQVLSLEVKTKILEIVPSGEFTGDLQRQEVIAFLFKHYLDRTVVFV